VAGKLWYLVVATCAGEISARKRPISVPNNFGIGLLDVDAYQYIWTSSRSLKPGNLVQREALLDPIITKPMQYQ
jgi:hypothetical protein